MFMNQHFGPFKSRFVACFLLAAFCLCVLGNVMLNAQVLPQIDVSEVASSDSSAITYSISVISQILSLHKENRLADWLLSNWYLLILTLIGLARALILITPTPKDNKFWNRYLVSPIKFVLTILSLNKPKS